MIVDFWHVFEPDKLLTPYFQTWLSEARLFLLSRDAKMEMKPNTMQYRERLDKTLSSPDLTNVEMLEALVKNQLYRSSEPEIEGNNILP